jgi:transcriptional regulator with XRE-family HTH domain
MKAGVAKSTLSEWENGRTRPRMSELESALSALQVTPEQRKQALATIQAPRAIARLAAEGDRRPVAGDLLRAMRLRRKLTQAELAQLAGVTQGMIAKWERSEDWPSPQRLHAVCFALQAHPEELAALLNGRFDPTHSFPASLNRDAVIALPRTLNRLTHPHLVDLRAFSLMAELIALSDRDAYADLALTYLYGQYARYLFAADRPGEAQEYADRALHRRAGGWEQQELWLDAFMTRVLLLRARGASRARELVRSISDSLPMVTEGTYRAWMCSEMAMGLAALGRGDLAVRSSRHAMELVGECHEPRTEGYNRAHQHLQLLMMVHDTEELKRFLAGPMRDLAQRHVVGMPHRFHGQVEIIRALYAVGAKSEAEEERAWVDAHIESHQLEEWRPNWAELIGVET